MRKVPGIAALTLLACCSTAAANDYSNRSSHTGFNLPGVQTPTGFDEVRASDGTTCRSAMGSRGAYLDMGGVVNEDRGRLSGGSVYGRLIVPLGQKPQRIDCDSLYQIEVERLRLEVAAMRAAAERRENEPDLAPVGFGGADPFGPAGGDDPFGYQGLSGKAKLTEPGGEAEGGREAPVDRGGMVPPRPDPQADSTADAAVPETVVPARPPVSAVPPPGSDDLFELPDGRRYKRVDQVEEPRDARPAPALLDPYDEPLLMAYAPRLPQRRSEDRVRSGAIEATFGVPVPTMRPMSEAVLGGADDPYGHGNVFSYQRTASGRPAGLDWTTTGSTVAPTALNERDVLMMTRLGSRVPMTVPPRPGHEFEWADGVYSYPRR